MELISYAQNQEDVMLWRALRHAGPGFYVDIGAADPEELSVTRLFYDRGWCGINVEPNSAYLDRLNDARPRDVNLLVAVASVAGVQTFHQIPGTGLSTLDSTVAASHRKFRVVEDVRVECRTLAEICSNYAPAGPVHFLKIDVEGAEADVLQSGDFTCFRPWIVVIEAVEPTQQRPNHLEWEPGLLTKGYSFAWFDGLNRFYLANEQLSALRQHFTVQPNIFDGFVRAAEMIPRLKEVEAYGANERSAREKVEEALGRISSELTVSSATLLGAEGAREAATLLHREAQDALVETARQYGESELRCSVLTADVGLLESQLRAAEAKAAHRERELIAQCERQSCAAEVLHAAIRTGHQADLARLTAEIAANSEAVGVRVGQAIAQAVAAEQRTLELQAERINVEEDLRNAERRRSIAEAGVDSFRASSSWRITRPLRVLVYLLRRQIGVHDISRVLLHGVAPRLRTAAGHALSSAGSTDVTGTLSEEGSDGVQSKAVESSSAEGPEIVALLPSALPTLTVQAARFRAVMFHIPFSPSASLQTGKST